MADSEQTDRQQTERQQTDSRQVHSEFKSKRGLKRIFAALRYSIDGYRVAWQYEHAFRPELMVVVPGGVVALLLPVSVLEKLALVGVLVLILVVELINSAIEAVVDRVSLDRHPLSKNAKDQGSAAVMLCCFFALVTWGVIVLPLFLS